MILLTSTGRPIARALDEGLTRQGHSVRSPFTSSSLELFVSALGCRAIIYTAGNSLLASQVTPTPSPARARQAALVAAVPGVELLVGIVPAGGAYVAEEELLQAAAVPSVLLRCAPLVQELGGGAPWTAAGALRVTTGELLSATVQRALEESSWHGRTIEVPTIQLNPAWASPRVVRRSSVDVMGVPAFA